MSVYFVAKGRRNKLPGDSDCSLCLHYLAEPGARRGAGRYIYILEILVVKTEGETP